MNIGILGGGLSGLTLHHFLKHESLVMEKEKVPGGLCRSFTKEGFTYDIGGHILFSKNKDMMNVAKDLLKENIQTRRRNNQIYFKGKYVKYPFENGLGVLDKEDIYECLLGYLKNSHPKPKNFKEWIYYTFGNGIGKKYLEPYNNKIWKTPLEDMDIQWVERVPRPPLEDIIKSSLGIETEGYLHQLYFLYPISGGIQSLINSLIDEKSQITTSFEIKKIYKNSKNWIVSNGKDKKEFDKLISTIPLRDLVKSLDGVPDDIIKAIKGLRYNAIRVILIGLKNESLLDKSALYIPREDVLPHRVCMMGYFSSKNVPAGKSSIIAEITEPPESSLYKASNDELVQKTILDLDRVDIIDKRDICTTMITRMEYGYVVYDSQYRENIKKVKKYFNDIGIELLGRFGQHEYINMDEVLRRSIQCAQKFNKLGLEK